MPRRPLFSQSVALLKHATPFATGTASLCYVHPDNPDLCLKVQKPEKLHKRNFLRRLPSAIYHYTENVKNADAYRQKAVRHGGARIWEHLPRLHGWQNTDIGLGLVSDYYSTPDGRPAPTLRGLLHAHGMTRELNLAIADFTDFLHDMQVLTRRINLRNLVYARDGRLKLIDDVGSTGVMFADMYKGLGKRRIRRNIRDIHKRIAWELSDRSHPWDKWQAETTGRWLPAFDRLDF